MYTLNLKNQTSGIYLLLLNNIVVYVGQSNNLLSRIGTHSTEAIKTFDIIQYIECGSHELDSTELYYIRKYKPIHNIANNTSIGNLHKVLSIVDPTKRYTKGRGHIIKSSGQWKYLYYTDTYGTEHVYGIRRKINKTTMHHELFGLNNRHRVGYIDTDNSLIKAHIHGKVLVGRYFDNLSLSTNQEFVLPV